MASSSSLKARLSGAMSEATDDRPGDATRAPEQAPADVDTPEPAAPVELVDWSVNANHWWQVPVHTAVARVMAEIGAVGKGDRFKSPQANYDYRGIDRVVNAVKPITRRHGVLIVPSVVEITYRDIPKASGGKMQECTVTMQYRFIGPMGDHIDAVVAGEAIDTADKAAAKAQSVAWRVALIQVFQIATQDEDPDSIRHERGDAPPPKAADYVEEICDPRTTFRRLLQIKNDIARFPGLGAALVTNETGDEEALGAMLWRIGKQRQESEGDGMGPQ